MTYQRLIFSSLIIPLFIPIAQADPTNNLDPVVVTATRFFDLAQLPASTTVISADEINLSPARTLSELLAEQVGITSKSLFSHASRTSVGIRSFGETATQNTLILLDGRRLNDIDLSSVNFAAIAVENIKRIEVVRGSGTVLYGDGATTGTINIITKDPVDIDDKTKLTMKTGSFDHRETNLSTNYSTPYFSIAANINSLKDDGYRDNNQFRQNTGQIDIRVPTRHGQLYIKAGIFEQDSELPGVRTLDPTITINQLETNPTGTDTGNDWADEYTEFSTLGMSQNINQNDSFVIDAGFRRKRQRSQFDYGGGFGDYAETAIQTISFTPRLSLNRAIYGHTINWQLGADLYLYQYDSKRSNFKQNIAQPAHTIAVDQKNLALYSQASMDLGQQSVVTLGLRRQKVRQQARDRFDSTASGAAFGSEAADYSESETKNSFELGLRHHFSNHFSSYARIGRSVRFGSVDELFERDSGFQQVFSRLNPQTSKDIELGFSVHSTEWNASLAIFHQSIDDEIHFNPISFQNINLDDTQHQGVELAFSFELGQTTQLKANYTYLKAEFTDGDNRGNHIPLIPQNVVNISIYKQLPYQVTGAMSFNYVDNSYFANDLDNSFGRKIPSYKTLDLKLSKQFNNVAFALQINNLFNEQYFNFGVNSNSTAGRFNGYPLPERTAYLSMSIDLN